MKRGLFTILLGLWFAAVLAVPPALAQEKDDLEALRKRVENQEKEIDSLLDRIDRIDESRQDGEAQGKIPAWIEKINIRGDFRYRHEMINAEGSSHRNRHRIRARVFIGGQVNELVDIGFQLATGNFYDDGLAQDRVMGDNVSTNQTLDEGWSSKPVWLDLAYFDYHPFRNKPGSRWDLSIQGGKILTPFAVVSKTELLWDPDLRPEGVALKASRKIGDLELFGSAGGFYIEERGSGADTGMFGAQAGVHIPVSDSGNKLTVGAGYYGYGNVQGEEPLFDSSDSFGNTVDGAGNYAEDFTLAEAFAEFAFEALGIPVALFGNAVTNLAADHAENGALGGIKLGKAKAPGTVDFRWQYKRLQADAVVAAFTDSDFGGGGTDSKGHELNLNVALAEDWMLALSYFKNRTGLLGPGATEYFERIQVDLKFKF